MVTVLLLLNVVALVDRNIINMLVVPIQRDLRLSDMQMGIVLGPAFAFAYVIFGLPFGWATDRYPRRWVIALGSTIWSVAMAAGGFASGLAGLITSRALVGAGEVALSPAAFSLIGDRLPPNRMTTAIALYSTGPKLSQAAAFLIGSILIGYASAHHVGIAGVISLTGWRLVLVMIGLPGLFMTLLVFTFSEPVRKQSTATHGPIPALVPFLRSEWRLLVPMLVAASSAALMYVTMLAWFPTYLTRQFGWEAQRYGPLMFWVGIVSAVGVIFKGMFVDWLVRRGVPHAHLRFYFCAILVAAPAAFLAFTVANPITSIVAYGVSDGLSSAAMLYFAATIQLYLPHRFSGLINALFLMAITIIASGGGPMAAAYLTEHVFSGPAALGKSLNIVALSAATVAAVAIWISLKQLPRTFNEAPQLLA
jgi:MFS family permease